MLEKFKKGTRIPTVSGIDVIIDKHLAEGGQGDVYLIDFNGQKKVLKWYKNGSIKQPDVFYDHLTTDLAPSKRPSNQFIWPISITKRVYDSYGYVMDLIPNEYKELSEFMLGSETGVKFTSFKGAVQACLEIVSAFRILHNKGYCYQDMNDGNFFINPKTGHVLICDNDNVTPNNTDTFILGTPRYMAPEVVTGGKKPNTDTDRFSMAVILFMILCMNHPLEGLRWTKPCLTPSDERVIYGTDPVFMYDPKKDTNRPVKGIHNNVIKRWGYLPKYIQEMFIKAFSEESIKNPQRRLREIDYMKLLVRYQSEIVRCPKCNNEIFIQNAATTKCDECGKPYVVERKIKLSDYSVTAANNTIIYRCQIDTLCDASVALDRVAWVVQAKDGSLWIKNMSQKIFVAFNRQGQSKPLRPGEVLPVLQGIKFQVFDKEIVIE